MPKSQKLMLVILDGWGLNPRKEANAIELARSPVWHGLIEKYPMTELDASGESVGLRAGLMGNSEVGHLNIGAGRVVWQDITRIDKMIDSGEFFRHPVVSGELDSAKKQGGRAHLLGLVSDGGVHSDEKHYFALIEACRRAGVETAFHAFMDGRDTPPTSGTGYVKRLVQALKGAGRVATVIGRYYAMDRDKRWERTEQAWKAIVDGEGRPEADPVQAVEGAYARGETDEFIKPIVLQPPMPIKDGDAVVCFNFRADRMRQFTRAFTEKEFDGFPRARLAKASFATMTRYHEGWTHIPCVSPPQSMGKLLGQVLSERGLRQLRIAETEKYAHVTFFFNGGSDTPFRGEERLLIPSQKVATYDLKPEMSAPEVTDNVLRAIESDAFDVVILNYANPDMVGHSGVLPATIRAVEVVDGCLDRILGAARKRGWTSLVTADHGNCEQMVDYRTGQPHTYHTTNPVPFVVVDDRMLGERLRSGGTFKDVAPTILQILGIPKPAEMTGEGLLQAPRG
ncbi:MAG: 2,3-bisphosphoglycerate-independent phosphoglycerate mutase [Planctomycetes bacterium]|nr:2,3-bisphosphoglycerate-independent phosphoglycerate mutase [Planctomycetota bacterium]